MKRKVAVVVPFYHNNLSKTEQIALQQCLKILVSYPIILLVPEKMKEEAYPDSEKVMYQKVPDSWLESIRAYNQMMLSKEFYELFVDYEYILLYQLDAFVFEDRLQWFCDLGYDYIGAPWLYGARYYLDYKHCSWYVGNGGLSLRKVASCIRLLEERKEMLVDRNLNEDLFFAMGASETYRVAPIEVALKFSIEQEVEKAFEKNKRELPFGCHAWEKYHLSFWKPFIEQQGYQLELPLENGNGDELLLETYQENRTYAEFMKHQYKKDEFGKRLQGLFQNQKQTYAIWGAGVYGRELCGLLEDASIEISCILDNNVELENTFYRNHRIMTLKTYMEEHHTSSIIIALKKYQKQVATQLEQNGFRRGFDFIFYKDIINTISMKELEE